MDTKKINEKTKEVKEKKPQKISKSYTLKALKGNIEKLYKVGLIDEKEKKIMNEIRGNAVSKWIEE